MRAAAEHDRPQAGRQAPAVTLEQVTKVYPGDVRALDGVSLTVERGTFLAVMGPSGSGKSTLMHCAAGLDTPTSGTVLIDGTPIGGLNETRRTELRRASGSCSSPTISSPRSASRTTSRCRCGWRARRRTATGCGCSSTASG